MPSRKVFVRDYGRSASYAIKKRRRERPREIVIVNDSEDDTSGSDEGRNIQDAGGSSSERSSENLGNSSLDQIPEAVEMVTENQTVHIENEEGNPIASEEFYFDCDSEVEFDDDNEDNDNIDLIFDGGSELEFDADDDDECWDAENTNNDKPLFDGASITLGESMMNILSFVLCHNLTGTALSDLLILISLLCGQTCVVKKSLFLFRKHFKNIRSPLIKHFYCTVCCSPLATSTSECETSREHTGVSYFIEISILEQLKTLFNRPGFYESLRHRFDRAKSYPSNLDDVYDGDVYREFSRDHEFLASPSGLSFMWNTDGVPIFKSSGFQIWPFYLGINELPILERTKAENILLAGLWFGPQKPSPNLFMQPFDAALQEISEGVYLNVPNRERPVKVKGKVICGTCDLPAKALFLNITQFNGRYGCPKCKLRGQSEEGVWTYPFKRELDERTEEESYDYAEEALRTNIPVFGIKGPSVLDRFAYKYIRTTAVDSMHCVFLGVTKKLCSFFFDPAFSSHPASLSHSIDLIDSRLCALSVPSFLQRYPRSIKRHIKYWKASELKGWLLYYSIPILRDIMLPGYLEHYCMLVLAIYTLSQSSITPTMLEKASRLLVEFVNRFDILYGDRYMSCNVHQLLHLPQTVRDFGPLWVTSCFPFENLNGILKRFVHSSHHPEIQICNAVSSFLNFSTLRHTILVPGSDSDIYCSTLTGARKKIRLEHATEGISIVGRCCEVLTLPEMSAFALAEAAISGTKYKTFTRLMKDHSLYTSESYARSRKYDNKCVRYVDKNSDCIGIIHSFVKVYNCMCHFENICECYAPIYAIIRQCTLTHIVARDIQRDLPDLVSECASIAQQAVAVDAQQLRSVCFLMKISDSGTQYIAIPANTEEVE